MSSSYRCWISSWISAVASVGLLATAYLATTGSEQAIARPLPSDSTNHSLAHPTKQIAQVPPPDNLPEQPPNLPPAGNILPELPPDDDLPDEPLPPLPSLEELFGEPSDPNLPPGVLEGGEETFVVSEIQLAGSTVFSDEDFAELFDRFTDVPITFNELLQVRSAVTQRYVEAGFVTSGAFIPPQTLENGVVTVQVLEGSIEEIEVVGTSRLRPAYVRSRLGLVAQPPINTNRLLAGLQRLKIDPLIETVSADLQAGVRPGTSVLRVEVSEADAFDITASVDNRRSPNIGSVSRRLDLQAGNVSGLGDRIFLGYTNTNGSNGIDASYSIPLSPHNTRLNFEGGYGGSRVIEDTFEVLDLSSNAFYYEIGITHPLIESPTQEISLGLALSHTNNQIRSGLDDLGPAPLVPGADGDGRSKVSALRFSQSWTQRDQRQVLAARSQFNLGLNILGATNNDATGIPDSQFFSWRGQGQWVRLLGEDALFFLRGDLQLATDRLFSSEQFGLGGQQTIRGYRQNALLRDNGALVSAEARLPIIRFSRDSIVQIAPFLDVGTAWDNFDDSADTNVLAGTGIGLIWEQNEDLSARLDWGIPLVDLDSTSNSLQDSGIYFSVRYNLF
ncbi:ShlB/FhaC/HecB family hemolysin secretion/activation protein [cf. Phormidesmis sp. LEGE 11477]|uniref:ShlB/FhaC/HecB family hemolysin secretion/activation protein n=1 Tax=cf. Phormidesmis sp. LEGE 11477 TaxID=1828680 RepID=UPI00187E9623|nr:ShlB/FhaC/HecB family hemolysin secretion/activation protein [cf. Phormidesmis sp. LEGE 11477]MBE9064629.1 ShlB/FhaC/HecB family hemolysin secretion/activation protein [cf. Phormidesmis sp. LEGE 11477]